MSRCFPYPPSEYTLSKASNEALIESIKLKREKKNTKSERKKEKKREKKEKKREKKEKKKAEEEKAKLVGQFDHDAFGGKGWENVKGGFLLIESKDDSEHLERSGVTEEHEQPVCSQNPSNSSESTQNSSKCKRHGSPLKETCIRGNILRIRLLSQNHIQRDIKDRDEQMCSTSGRTDIPAEQIWSTSGRTDAPPEHKNDAIRVDPDKSCSSALASDFIIRGPPIGPDQDLTQASSSQQPDVTSQEIVHADSGSKRYKKMKRAVKRYRNLIENWTPPSHLSERMDVDDEDWLFGGKHQEKQPEKKVRVSRDMSCSNSSSLWTRAQYLQDADVYALPYTVLF